MSNFNDDIELDEHGLPVNPNWYTDEDDNLDIDEDFDDDDNDYEELSGRYGDNMSPKKKKADSQNNTDAQTQSSTSDGSGKKKKTTDTHDSNKSLVDHDNKPNVGDASKATKQADDAAKTTKQAGKTTKQASKTAKKVSKTAKNTKETKAIAESAKAALAAIKAVLPILFWVLLIVLIIVIIVSIALGVVSLLDQKTNPDYMRFNANITDEYFYGMRVVYIDNEQLSNSLELSYKQYVIDFVENFEENNPNIDLVIALPSLDEDETFNNSMQVDANITNLYLGIANIVATNSNDYVGIEFDALYPQINYFGLDSAQYTSVVEFISNYITINNLYSTADTVDIDTLVSSTLEEDEDLQYMRSQYEKVMIKDEIAKYNGISNFEQRQYIASIYMPNKNIIVESISYAVTNENQEFNTDIKLIEYNNNTETIHAEHSLQDNQDVFGGFSFGKVNLNTFQSIDSDNVEKFSEGLSLLDAVRSLPSDTNYFKKDAQTGIYSWMPNESSLLYLTFETNNKFIYTEWDINVKPAS